MSYTSQPWTLNSKEPKTLKAKREEMQMKEISKKVEENLPVAVARVVKFLNENKEQTYTNSQIAAATGVKSVSGIMDKLEEIGVAKVVKIRKSLTSGISQVYQSGLGACNRVEKERMAQGVITQVLSLFEKSTNKIWSKKEISEESGISRDKVGTVLSVLLVTGKIKAVGEKDGALVYQNIKGNKKAIPISVEADSNYITLGNYIRMNGIKGNSKGIKAAIAKEKGHSRLFYSSKRVVKEYEVTYLQKVIGLGEKKSKKGLIERIKVW